jgi:flagellar L-ring protein FlgH
MELTMRPTQTGVVKARGPVRCLLCIAVVGSLVGCNTLSRVPEVDLAQVPDEPPISAAMRQGAAPVAGGLYSTASFRPGFEDNRARLVGDLLTIQITESLQASQASTSNASRTTNLNAGVSALPFASSRLVGRLGANATTENSLDGSGTTTAVNSFEGVVTATVVQVMPNGHLVVVGEKQIGVNQNVDVLKFSGTVDPRSIGARNVVSSSQVANLRVLNRGRGAQNDAQTYGWLSRFFLTLSPF